MKTQGKRGPIWLEIPANSIEKRIEYLEKIAADSGEILEAFFWKSLAVLHNRNPAKAPGAPNIPDLEVPQGPQRYKKGRA